MFFYAENSELNCKYKHTFGLSHCVHWSDKKKLTVWMEYNPKIDLIALGRANELGPGLQFHSMVATPAK